MTENENLLRLKEISSTVSERDLKIYENVAHSICIKKAGEKLKSEIERMRLEINKNKKENDLMKSLMLETDSTIKIQKDTLRMSEQSLVMHQDLVNSLLAEASELRKKYSKTLEMYEDEYEDYKNLYESSSITYQDLKKQKIDLKKLQVKSMLLDMKIQNLQNSQKQYKTIQKKIFQNTITKFAQFYILYHKNEALNNQVLEKKSQEQQLLKEHLQLQEKLKQKKKFAENKPEKPQLTETLKENPPEDKFKKFLDEELKPCSLTSLDFSQRVPSFNQQQTKVKILEVKTLKPPLKPTSSLKGNELRKKMETIMENAKNEAKLNNSYHISPLCSQKTTEPIKTDTQSKQSSQEIKGSILKKKLEICNSQETTSKFFEKKKSVTFENQIQKKPEEEKSKFEFLYKEEQKSESVKNLDIFQNRFFFKNEQKKKTVVESETETSDATSNVTFTGDTGTTTFGTFGESADKQNEMAFGLFESSFNRSFINPPETSDSEPTFSFLASQTIQTNPFNFS